MSLPALNPRLRSLARRAAPGQGGKDFGRWVTPEELNVAPGLLGMPLARPTRRLLAMGVDLAAIGIVSSFSNFWLLFAVALGVFERARTRRKGPSTLRTVLAWLLVALMAYAGVRELVDDAATPRRSGSNATAADDDDDDIETPESRETKLAVAQALQAAANKASNPTLTAVAAAASAVAASAVAAASAPAAAASDPVLALQARVHQLQRQLAKEREATERATHAQNWHERLRQLGLDFGIGYGWSLVYFTMLPTWWRGQTLGKRLFGLRVLEITGKPMTPLLNFKRFGGYLAGMATGGLGLVQLLWDPNRQGLQDKAAHTVVVDERAPRRPEPAAVAAPPASPSGPGQTEPS